MCTWNREDAIEKALARGGTPVLSTICLLIFILFSLLEIINKSLTNYEQVIKNHIHLVNKSLKTCDQVGNKP